MPTTEGLRFGVMIAVLSACGLVKSGASEAPVSGYRGPKPTPFDVAVERGVTRRMVRDLAGPPDAVIGPNIWVYADCRLTGDPPPGLKTDTVLIGFEKDVVSVMKIVPITALRPFVANGRMTAVSARLKRELRNAEPHAAQ